jgi:CspA family cold shock protein
MVGVVKWFNNSKGYGFIKQAEGEGDDIFVHFRQIRGEGYRTLQEGQRVEFIMIEGQKGLQAEDVAAVAE